MDEKVEENMGTIVGIKLSMNCCEINVDTTMNKKNTQTWMQKGGKIGLKNGCKHGPNMGAIVDTKLDSKLDASEVDVKVDAKWDAKNRKII